MIRDFGIVEPGTTLYIPFHTFDSNDPSASVTLTGLATTDIEVYKDGSTTQRASDAGYALLDTDGIDFDATTGIHGISINLADNTTAGFYAAGSQYWVVIASVTVDAATVNFVLCTFRIGYQNARLNTTIATLSSQTSFTLTNGPAEDDALNGCWCIIHDVASAVQQGHAIISDYTGSTKTVTLAAGTTFTAAATDNIAIMGPMPMQPTVAGRTLDVSTGGEAGVDWANVGTPGSTVSLSATTVATVTTATNVTTVNGLAANVITATSIAADAITAAKIADGAIDAATFAAGAINAAAIASDAITDAKVASDVTIASVTGAVGSVTGAVGSVTGNVGGNVTGSVGSIATGGITEASFATTAGSFAPLGIVDQGTAQSATSTTLVLRSAAAFANDELIGATIVITGGSAGVGQAREITDYVSSTDTATVDTWTVTPTGTITYKVFAGPPSSTAATAAIADAVWDEILSGHAVSGSTGEALSAAGGAGDPWITALPGSYTSGQAGHTIGTYLTGNAFTRLGAPAGASVSADVAAVKAETAAIVADTNELQTDWVNGGRLDLILDARASQTSVDTIDGIVDSILVDTAEIGAAGAGLTALATQASVNTIDDLLDTEVAALTTELAKVPKSDGTATWNATALASLQAEAADALNAYDPPTRAELTTDTNSILTAVADVPTNAELATALGTADDAVLAAVATVDTVVDAIKAKTDSLTFTQAGHVDANVQRINDVAITGDGQPGTEFGV